MDSSPTAPIRHGFNPTRTNHQIQPTTDSTHNGFNPTTDSICDGCKPWSVRSSRAEPFVYALTPDRLLLGTPQRQRQRQRKRKIKRRRQRKRTEKEKKKISKDAAHGGLSHFVAPLYVAPSTTPGNAKPTSESFVICCIPLTYSLQFLVLVIDR